MSTDISDATVSQGAQSDVPAALRFRYDPEAGALYVRMREGAVADTIEVEELVYLDVDEDGRPLGIEFVVAEQLPEFLTRRGGEFVLPAVVSDPDALAVLSY